MLSVSWKVVIPSRSAWNPRLSEYNAACWREFFRFAGLKRNKLKGQEQGRSSHCFIMAGQPTPAPGNKGLLKALLREIKIFRYTFRIVLNFDRSEVSIRKIKLLIESDEYRVCTRPEGTLTKLTYQKVSNIKTNTAFFIPTWVQVNPILHPDMPWTHYAWQMDNRKKHAQELVSKNSNNFSDLHLHFFCKKCPCMFFVSSTWPHQKEFHHFLKTIQSVSLKIEEQKHSLCSFLVQSSLHFGLSIIFSFLGFRDKWWGFLDFPWQWCGKGKLSASHPMQGPSRSI